jgi:hypothetical protein
MASSGFKVPYQRTDFVPFAESLNGRVVMLGFVIAIATEALSGKGILGQLGLGDEPPDSRSADHGLAGHSSGWPFCQRLRVCRSVRPAAEAAAEVPHLLQYVALVVH